MRVVIGEDSILLRQGMARILADAGFEVVGQAGDYDGLVSTVLEECPDVVVADIRLPPTWTDEGIRAVAEIRHSFGATVGILVLSQYLEPAFALKLVSGQEGPTGYLLKERIADLAEFAEAVRRVGRGGTVIDPAIVAALVGRRRDPLTDLTDREREVMALVAQGRSNAAICDRLLMSLKTVEAHVTTIFSKLGLEPAPDDNRRVLAVLAYLRDSGRLPGPASVPRP